MTLGVDDLLRDKREDILLLAKQHGAYDVRVFGSVAEGLATAESDIDLVVKVFPNTSPWFPVGLVCDLEELLNRRVEVITEGSLHWYIRDKVLKEAVPL